MQVYIPTMKRLNQLEKVVKSYSQNGYEHHVRVVVAQNEFADTDDLIGDLPHVEVLPLPPRVKGIGAIRNWIVNHAHKDGNRSIIMADDDIMPHHRADFEHMEMAIRSKRILGIGCVTSYHSLLLDDRKEMLKGQELIFARSGYGFRMFAINIQNAIDIGNFDPMLDTCFEDAEFMRQGVSRGLLWYLDPKVKAVPLGKRFAPGGLEAFTGDPLARDEMTGECYRRCYERWPSYMAKPPRRRMSWQKMLNECIPDWRRL